MSPAHRSIRELCKLRAFITAATFVLVALSEPPCVLTPNISEPVDAGALGSTGFDPGVDVPVLDVPVFVDPALAVPVLGAARLGAELDVANASAGALVELDATGGVFTAPPPPPPQPVNAAIVNATAAVKENAVEAREVFRRSMVSMGVSLPPSELKSFEC